MVAGLLVFVPVSGFLGYTITNDVRTGRVFERHDERSLMLMLLPQTCAVVICATAVIIVLCLTMNNALAVMHVSSLWDYDRVSAAAVCRMAYCLSYTPSEFSGSC
jgi:hypothetical protein